MKAVKGSTLQQLPEQVIALVLSCLATPEDFVHCALVCKKWAKSMKSVRAQRLSLVGIERGWSEERENGVQLWLAANRKGKFLKNLGHLEVDDETYQENDISDCLHESALASPLFKPVLKLISCSTLHSCDLRGEFSLIEAIQLLPPSNFHLALCPRQAPGSIQLSVFQKLPKLQTLGLCTVTMDLDFDNHNDAANWTRVLLHGGNANAVYKHETCKLIIVSTCKFGSLQSLQLHNKFSLGSTGDCNLKSCLPVLTKLKAKIIGDKRGLQLASNIMQMPCLRQLDIALLDSEMDSATLIIPETSLIEKLRVEGPKWRSPRITMELATAISTFEYFRLQKVCFKGFSRQR